MVGLPPLQEDPSIFNQFVSAGLAGCVADIISFPLDLAKVRLQIQGEGVSTISSGIKPSKAVNKGLFSMIYSIVKQEGFKSLYNGLNAGLQRQMCFCSVRIGLYESFRNQYGKILGYETPSQNSVTIRVLAAITTGGLSVVLAQPTDVVKVRMQAQVTGAAPRYGGTMSAYKKISVQEGMKGLWKGTLPNVTRNAIVNAAEVVVYDSIKHYILHKNYLPDRAFCHFLSAVCAGFCATVVASPVDVVKTRFMNSRQGQYSGVTDCAVKMFNEGGFTAFYKGFVPSFIRLGTWNILMFLSFEQLKRFFALVGERDFSRIYNKQQ